MEKNEEETSVCKTNKKINNNTYTRLNVPHLIQKILHVQTTRVCDKNGSVVGISVQTYSVLIKPHALYLF